MKNASWHETHLFVKSSSTAGGLADRLGDGRILAPEPGLLRLVAGLKKGYHEMSFQTAAGTFPSDSLMLPLLEWPSRRTVPAGPFDFDHTAYTMTVPTFRVSVNGRDGGLVWAEVPSPEDFKAGRIRAMWGIETEEDGEQVIELRIAPDESRLRWPDVEALEIRPDDRTREPLRALGSGKALPPHPRLFAGPAAWAALGASRDPVQERLFKSLLRDLEDGHDGTYVYRTVTAALIGRLTGEARWMDEAVTRTLALCERPHWGYHNTPDIMGSDNDRDAGLRLYETAVVYDWLHDRLTAEQRNTIRTRLAKQAALAYQVTLVQKSYWYYRANEAHGLGFWFGFAAAAAALAGEDPRAAMWLEWIHGNILDSLAHMPADGINEWLVFCAQWLVLSVMLLERLEGRRLRGDFPYLAQFARRAAGVTGGSDLGTLLFYLAARRGDRTCQADALRAAKLAEADAAPEHRHFDPLTLLAYDPAIRPGRPTVRPLSIHGRGGMVLCRSRDRRVQFTFRCGTRLTPELHEAHNWIAQCWYHVPDAGSFQWVAEGRELIPAMVPGYRRLTTDANAVSVDGAGHPCHGRWLGYGIALRDTAFIESYASGRDVTFCLGNGSGAYTPESGVLRRFRRWVFFHGPGLLLMHDRIELDRPRLPAWHLHTVGPWRAGEAGVYETERNGVSLAVRSLWSRCGTRSGAGEEGRLTARTEAVQFVPPYTLGLNVYKTLDWQPEIHGIGKQIPDYQELRFQPAEPVERWDLVTLMGDPPAVKSGMAAETDGQGVCVELGQHGSVSWNEAGAVTIEPLGVSAEAELVVRLGPAAKPRGWIGFRTRRWQAGEAGRELSEPADLIWTPGCCEPHPLKT